MSGLNRHLRDLLMAARPETLRLIEMTGTLLERYRTQAGACDVGFLFGAIACLTELDGKIRQSSNQRLLVELGLMKIARLGQKKNDPLTSSSEEYPLPDLQPQAPCGAAGSAAVPAAVAARPAAAETSAEAVPNPNSEPLSKPAIEATNSEPESQPADISAANTPGANIPVVDTSVASASQASASPAAPAAGPQADNSVAASASVGSAVPKSSAPRTPRKSLISGASLADLLAAGAASEDAEEGGYPEERMEDPDFDPACSEKLERARGRILELIKAKRPRFVPVFELMTFRDNAIAVSVPTAELREEILRNKTAMLMRIAELAGIEGALDLEVTVNEEIRAARPIKPEDKVKFLSEKNPLVTELRKALDLEME